MSKQQRATILTGAMTGIFSGLTGVGGGAILVGMMVSFLGMSQHKAHGTSLAVIISLAFFGALTYAAQGYYDLTLTLALAFGSIFGVIAGARAMAGLPAAQLRRAFGIFLFFISLSMLAKGVLSIGLPGLAAEPVSIAPPVVWVLWIALGVVSGALAGFLGIGGAMVLVPAMALGAGFEQHLVQGISLAVITITSLVGAYTHYKLGNVEVGAAALMAPSAIVAVIVASLVAGQVDSFWLTKTFGVVLLGFAYQFTFTKGRQQARTAPPVPVSSTPDTLAKTS